MRYAACLSRNIRRRQRHLPRLCFDELAPVGGGVTNQLGLLLAVAGCRGERDGVHQESVVGARVGELILLTLSASFWNSGPMLEAYPPISAASALRVMELVESEGFFELPHCALLSCCPLL